MSGRRTLRLLRRLGSPASLLAAALPALAAKREFGPNVLILDPWMPSQAMNKQIDQVYATQQHSEFAPQRNALPFMPEAIRSRHHGIPISRAKGAREMGHPAIILAACAPVHSEPAYGSGTECCSNSSG